MEEPEAVMKLGLIEQRNTQPMQSLVHEMELNCNVPRSFDRWTLDIDVYSTIDIFLDVEQSISLSPFLSLPQIGLDHCEK